MDTITFDELFEETSGIYGLDESFSSVVKTFFGKIIKFLRWIRDKIKEAFKKMISFLKEKLSKIKFPNKKDIKTPTPDIKTPSMGTVRIKDGLIKNPSEMVDKTEQVLNQINGFISGLENSLMKTSITAVDFSKETDKVPSTDEYFEYIKSNSYPEGKELSISEYMGISLNYGFFQSRKQQVISMLEEKQKDFDKRLNDMISNFEKEARANNQMKKSSYDRFTNDLNMDMEEHRKIWPYDPTFKDPDKFEQYKIDMARYKEKWHKYYTKIDARLTENIKILQDALSMVFKVVSFAEKGLISSIDEMDRIRHEHESE